MPESLAVWAAGVGCLALTSCVGPAPPESHDGPFEEVAEVRLQESSDDPIVGLGTVSRRPRGGYVFADEGADRVRLFDRSGRIDRTFGRSGDGPGELDAPTSAVERPDGTVYVTQRSSPRLTIFGSRDDPILRELPGHYGYWISALGEHVVVGMGSRTERFAVLSPTGERIATFGTLPVEVDETPFWIFFARQHATVSAGRVITNTSFFPTFHAFDADGDSLYSFGEPPPSWRPPTAPPVDRIREDADRARIEEWSRSFTVVRGIATAADSLVVVQYGRHDPSESDPYRVVATTVDVYSPSGEKLVEDLPFADPIVGGGRNLLVLSAEPPAEWTLSVVRWRGGSE